MRKKFILISAGSDSGSKNANEAIVALVVGSGAFGRNLASVAVKIFSRSIYLKRNVINVVLSVRFAKIMLK
jgi:hypothetical protein